MFLSAVLAHLFPPTSIGQTNSFDLFYGPLSLLAGSSVFYAALLPRGEAALPAVPGANLIGSEAFRFALRTTPYLLLLLALSVAIGLAIGSILLAAGSALDGILRSGGHQADIDSAQLILVAAIAAVVVLAGTWPVVAVRLAVILPAAARGARLTLRESWSTMRGKTWDLMICLLWALTPCALLEFAIHWGLGALGGSAPSLVLRLPAALGDFAVLAFSGTVFAFVLDTAYRTAKEDLSSFPRAQRAASREPRTSFGSNAVGGR